MSAVIVSVGPARVIGDIETVSIRRAASSYLHLHDVRKTTGNVVASLALIVLSRVAFQTTDVPESSTEGAGEGLKSAVKLEASLIFSYGVWILWEEVRKVSTGILQTKRTMTLHNIEVSKLSQEKEEVYRRARTTISSLEDRETTERLRALMEDIETEYSRFVESETECVPTRARELLNQLSQEINGISAREEALRATSTS